MPTIAMTDAEFDRLVGYVHENYGIDLSRKRVMIQGRLGNLLASRGFSDYNSFLNMVFSDKSGTEVVNLMNRLTTNHTYFLREPEHYEFLRSTFLPALEKKKKNKIIYLWSAACSSGEEPYTNEIELLEYFGANAKQWDTKILATDISTRVLAKAQQGIYHKDSMKNLSEDVKRKYFTSVGNDCFQVKDEVRKLVVFKVFNLMDTIPFRKNPFDLIFCRNVMIYFDMQTKIDLVNRFYDVIAPGGYLFIGHAESVPRDSTKFKYIKPAIYQKPE